MAENKEIKFTRGRQREILGHFYDNPNKDITIGALEKAFRGRYDRKQIMATMAHVVSPSMKAKYRYPIDRVTEGVWRLGIVQTPQAVVEAPTPEPAPAKKAPEGYQELWVTIIKENDNEMVVVDEYANVYRMVQVA